MTGAAARGARANEAWSSRRVRVLTLCAAMAGLAASLTLYDSPFVRAGAVGALLLAVVRLLWPHRLAPGPPLPELLLLSMPLSFIQGQELLSTSGLPLYDQYLYQLDAWLGQPGFAAGRVLAEWPALAAVCRWAYIAVPVVLPIAYLTTPTPGRYVASLLLSVGLGFACYWLIPAAGPRFTFPSYPWHEPVLTAQALYIPGAFPNCMPSLHLTWALLTARYSRWTLLMWPFVALTVASTLGLGEHYAIDLIAALPFTASIVWLVERSWRPRSRPASEGLPADGEPA
ncbi:MAG: phosphatase PAP2 family protein [Vicinamibacterales bacterium]